MNLNCHPEDPERSEWGRRTLRFANMTRALPLIAALLFLSITYAAPRPPVPHRPVPVIDCFGDSITAGYGVDPGKAYPDDLQNALDSHGYHYRVVNSGISGNTTKDGVDRLKEVLALHPAIVIVEFG